MATAKTEIEQLCESDETPDLVKEWGPVFVRLGITNSVMLVAQHEGLGLENPAPAGITSLLITLRTAIAAYFPNLTKLVDANSSDMGEAAMRGRQRAAMGYLHLMCYKQRPHSVEKQLAASGLGDADAREAAEARRRKENASKLATEMRDQTILLYNKPIDTNLWAEAALYVTVREGLQAKELRSFPDLDSAKLGKRGYVTKAKQRLVHDMETNELVTADDERVAIDKCGLVLLRIERALLLLLSCGSYEVDPAGFPCIGQAGKIAAGTASERRVAFGLDAFDATYRRFTLLRAARLDVFHSEP